MSCPESDLRAIGRLGASWLAGLGGGAPGALCQLTAMPDQTSASGPLFALCSLNCSIHCLANIRRASWSNFCDAWGAGIMARCKHGDMAAFTAHR